MTLESLAEGAADLCPQEEDLELIIMQLAKDKKLIVTHTDPEKQSKVCLKEIMVSPIRDQSLITGRRGGGHKTRGRWGGVGGVEKVRSMLKGFEVVLT